MRLLVAGATGQLARALCDAEKGEGVELVALGRPDLDIADPASVERAVEKVCPDLVINAAAYTAVDAAEDDEPGALAVNCDGVENLARTTAAQSIPLIHVSTDYVYDGQKKTSYVEDDATNPQNIYGRSKLLGEGRLTRCNPYHVILRTAWVYSPYGQNFLKTMLRLAKERDELGVVADQFGNPSYAPHLAEAILEIARQILVMPETERQRFWGIYHLAGHGETSWFGFAEEIFRASRQRGGASCKVKPLSTDQFPTRAARPANSRLDCTKLASCFGLVLPHWHEGVAQCLDQLSASSS